MARRIVGMALWLLRGPLVKRVEWVVGQEMGAVALHPNIMQADSAERREAAAAMRQAGLMLTYHPNVHGFLRGDGMPDPGYLDRLIDEVVWWHENTCGVQTTGVHACCCDPVQPEGPDGKRAFHWAANEALVRRLGIRVGIENSFGPPECYQSVDDVRWFAERCRDVPGLSALLDTGHVNVHLQGRPGIGEYVRQMPIAIAEVHVTDNKGGADEHRHLGYGTLDVKDLATSLAAVGFDGPLTIEVCVDILKGKYDADLNNPAEVEPLRVTRQRLREVWG